MSKLTSLNLIFILAVTSCVFSPRRSFASPQSDVPESPSQEETWPKLPPDENLSIATPPPLTEPPPPPDARYYSYPQAFTFRLGLASDLSPLNFQDNVVGFEYLFPKFLSPKLEAGADLHNDGNGHIHAGARWFWHERSYFRPSVKLAADHFVVSAESLGTLTHIDNYFVRASGTLEYVIWNPYSLRVEHELLFNHKKQSTEFTLGLSRGW